MSASSRPEYWLRGPVEGISAGLQPAAHALLQSREEVNALMEGFPGEKLWDRPGGMAAPGFHLQHLAGVLDRLLTYARGNALSPGQLEELAAEGRPGGGESGGAGGGVEDGSRPDESGPDESRPDESGANELVRLLDRYNRQIDKALLQLAETPESSLTEPRGVGRAKIPSTVGGLLFHAAEHSMRHTGQLLVTVNILRTLPPSGNR